MDQNYQLFVDFNKFSPSFQSKFYSDIDLSLLQLAHDIFLQLAHDIFLQLAHDIQNLVYSTRYGYKLSTFCTFAEDFSPNRSELRNGMLFISKLFKKEIFSIHNASKVSIFRDDMTREMIEDRDLQNRWRQTRTLSVRLLHSQQLLDF